MMAAVSAPARADVKLPAIFGDHMVLQRDQNDRVWGWADPGEEVTVSINDQTKTATAGADGKWQVTLDPHASRRAVHAHRQGQEHDHVQRRARGRGLDLLGPVEHAVAGRRGQ